MLMSRGGKGYKGKNSSEFASSAECHTRPHGALPNKLLPREPTVAFQEPSGDAMGMVFIAARGSSGKQTIVPADSIDAVFLFWPVSLKPHSAMHVRQEDIFRNLSRW